MTTVEIIQTLISRTNETAPVVTSLLNEVVRYIISQPLAQNLYYDPNNRGMPPFFSTTENEYRYTFPDGMFGANVLRVEAVLRWGRLVNTNISPRALRDRQRTYNLNNMKLTEVATTSKTATRTNPAEITFLYTDPGTTTDVWYLLFTEKPRNITSGNVELPIPEEVHLELIDGVTSIIKNEKYGDETAWERFKRLQMPIIKKSMNRGAQGRIGATVPQTKDRNYWAR